MQVVSLQVVLLLIIIGVITGSSNADPTINDNQLRGSYSGTGFCPPGTAWFGGVRNAPPSCIALPPTPAPTYTPAPTSTPTQTATSTQTSTSTPDPTPITCAPWTIGFVLFPHTAPSCIPSPTPTSTSTPTTNVITIHDTDSPYPVPNSIQYINVQDLTTNAVTIIILLPAATGSGRFISVKQESSVKIFTVRVDPNGTDTIDQINASRFLTSYDQAYKFVDTSSGGWSLYSEYQPTPIPTSTATPTPTPTLTPAPTSTATATQSGTPTSTATSTPTTTPTPSVGLMVQCGVNSAVTIGTNANSLLLYGFYLGYDIAFSKMAPSIGTLDNSANLYDFCVYQVSGNSLTLLADTGATSFTTTGVKSITPAQGAPVKMPRGTYYLGFTGNAGTAKLNGCAAINSNPQFFAAANIGTTAGGVCPTTVATPLPAATIGNQPAFGLIN